MEPCSEYLLFNEDISGSMGSNDGQETRQQKVRTQCNSLVQSLKDEVGDRNVRIFHRYFNHKVLDFVGPISILDYTNDEFPLVPPNGGTALYKSIVETMTYAAELPGRKKVVILTDGIDEDSHEMKERAIEMLDREFCNQHLIKVYIYGCVASAFGNKEVFKDVPFFGPTPLKNPICLLDDELEGAAFNDDIVFPEVTRSCTMSMDVSETSDSGIGSFEDMVRGITDDFKNA